MQNLTKLVHKTELKLFTFFIKWFANSKVFFACARRFSRYAHKFLRIDFVLLIWTLHPYIYYTNGWWNFNFFAGMKWVGFSSKAFGKNQKGFLRNLKQICVKLQGIDWKTFGLTSSKQSELDVRMKRKTGSSLQISTAWYWLWCTESIPL